jgi:hypothetical protein
MWFCFTVAGSWPWAICPAEAGACVSKQSGWEMPANLPKHGVCSCTKERVLWKVAVFWVGANKPGQAFMALFNRSSLRDLKPPMP